MNPNSAVSVAQCGDELRGLRGALQAVLERTRLLYDSSPLMYLLLDGQGAVMDGNQRAFQGLGRELCDLMGMPIEELLHEDSRGPLRRLLETLSSSGGAAQPVSMELQLRTPTGDLVTSASLTATCAADGTPVEIHVMMLDISEVRRLQQRMLQADRLASVGQLAAGVAHEINNPAAWVMTNLSYLQERLPQLLALLSGSPSVQGDALAAGELLAELPRLCAESLDGMRRIRDIVRDLQLFAREPKERRERVDLNALCDAVVHMALPEIRRRARLERSYGTLPRVLGDPGRLSQVLLNLLINAAQAIPEGDPGRHKVVLSTMVQDGGVAVLVRDTGCGIPQAVLPRIFDPFFTTKPPGKGTGLGLSVSYEIMRAHGGRLDVVSEVGVGTTFTMWLPCGASLEAEERADVSLAGAAEPQGAAAEGGPSASAGPHGKVLVIDDEPDLLRALARTLRPAHEVVVASSGADGIEKLRSHYDVDVVLCDVMMPQTSGMDLYESLPRALRDRFIFMSGDTASAAVQAFLGSVKVPHLSKPVEPAELLRVVEQAVLRRRGERVVS